MRAAGCVWADDEAELILRAAGTSADVEAMVARRAAGEPIEQVVGWAEFCSLRIALRPGVFVPRRRTEFLARQAADLARPGCVVVDLCCGSGALAAAVAHSLLPAGCEVWGADIDPVAVDCARDNLAGYGATVLQGDLFDALPRLLRGRVDVLMANVPYVATADLPTLPAEAREHEPPTALDGGSDGLGVFRRVAAEAPGWLAPGGMLLSEVTDAQVDAALAAVRTAGLEPDVARDGDLDATVVTGRRHR